MGQDCLTGVVRSLTYQSPVSDYVVFEVLCEPDAVCAVVVGECRAITAGAHVTVTGVWEQHPRHGRQMRLTHVRSRTPESPEQLIAYLSSGVLKGVKDATARRLVGYFGTQTLSILSDAPERLHEVPGLGAKRARAIADAWQADATWREWQQRLRKQQVSHIVLGQIERLYGREGRRIASEDPYRIMSDCDDVTFEAVAQLARCSGYPLDDPHRAQAACIQVLREAARQGHTTLDWLTATSAAARLLRADPTTTGTMLAAALANGRLIGTPDHWIALPTLGAAEARIAARLKDMIARPAEWPRDLSQRLTPIWQGVGWEMDELQRLAVERAFQARLLVVTGGPGTGKTTTIRALVAAFEACHQVVLLCAPTGRAARRLEAVCARGATTVHRMLDLDPEQPGFRRRVTRPLAADLVLVDEAAMLDVGLFDALLNALPPLAHLVLVGDCDQLPSVGPGSVLRDVLAVPSVPRVALQTVFRQAGQSLIVANAHRIRQGHAPVLVAPDGKRREDCYLVEVPNDAAMLATLADVVVKSLPRRLGLDAVNEIQVLSPVHGGYAGTEHLNRVLQHVLNPVPVTGTPVQAEIGPFRLGDRVMQIRNNQARGVNNGDLGVVVAVAEAPASLAVRFGDQLVTYGAGEWGELSLAYAMTVHKSQGSEFPAVVIPLLARHARRWDRQILYTALTRARQVAVLLGTAQAVSAAVGQGIRESRLTRLATLLSEPASTR